VVVVVVVVLVLVVVVVVVAVEVVVAALVAVDVDSPTDASTSELLDSVLLVGVAVDSALLVTAVVVVLCIAS
jgi:hypothetical protein